MGEHHGGKGPGRTENPPKAAKVETKKLEKTKISDRSPKGGGQKAETNKGRKERFSPWL